MARAESVVAAFAAVAEAAYAAGLAQVSEILVVAPREQLVRVALVRNVEKYLVFWRFEHAVQGYAKFHEAQIWADMAAFLRRYVYYLVPDFARQFGQFGGVELFNVLRVLYLA